MTALAERRTRRTIVGATVALALVIAASVMFTVGVITLSNSKEGEAVGIDTRPKVQLPATPNALLVVTDDDGALASAVVLTLLPDGQGGSIVVLPAAADTTAGFGLQRRPLDEVYEPDDPDGLTTAVEDMLSITVERTEIVDPAGLASLLAPIGAVQVVLPDAVVEPADPGEAELDDDSPEATTPADTPDDSTPATSTPAGSTPATSTPDGEATSPPDESAPDTSDPDAVVSAGPQLLETDEIVELLTTVDADRSPIADYETDVAMWTAIGQTAPLTVPADPVTTDVTGSPAPPTSVAELVARLWEGDVGVRDIAVTEPGDETNPTETEVVVLDRPDANLVFAQVSPGLVSTPNTGLKTRVVVGYTDEQLGSGDGLYDSNADVARGIIGQLLFLQGNVVSVDTSPTGAPEVSVIEVADPRWLEETRAAADLLFGPSEVSVATTVIEGVDVEVVLGTSYLQRLAGADDETTDEVTDTVARDGTVAPDEESDG